MNSSIAIARNHGSNIPTNEAAGTATVEIDGKRHLPREVLPLPPGNQPYGPAL
jgi:hypothetical protein